MMESSPFPESLVFILGSQRSGTTWLANIFDTNPETLLFMEPFAPAYGIFPEFPGASCFLESPSPYLDHLLRVEMPTRLLRYKSLLFRRSMIDPAWFRLERWIARTVTSRSRLVPNRLRKYTLKFELLNLNRMEDSYPLYPKTIQPPFWVIKELRFSGKIPILRHSFPQAYFIVIVRHPCATVHSIMNWFERGGLGELRRDIETYLEKMEVQAASKPYKNLIARCRNGSLAHKIALYWRISYETMFRQLETYSSFQFVVYEQLALQPKEMAVQIFRQMGIPWSYSIDEYLSYSTKAQPQDAGPVTTVRESATYYRSWMEEIPESRQQAVFDITRDSFLMSYFEPYYHTPLDIC